MKLVLLRHGESTWNRENRFTGWMDADLSENGAAEARQAGRLLKEKGYVFDIAFTSVLKRAIRTLWLVLDELDLMWIPVQSSWRLNERHYGSLQGLNKAEVAAKYGLDRVQLWRRSYDVRPPPLTEESPMYPGKDPRYAALRGKALPLTESLKDTERRVMPYWNRAIVPQLRRGERLLISAHGNSIRAIVKHLDHLSGEEIAGVNIPTGVPLVYELDEKLRPVKKYYLGDQAEIERRIREVAEQAKQG